MTATVLIDKNKVRKEYLEAEIKNLQTMIEIPDKLKFMVKIPKLTSIVDNKMLITLSRLNQVNLNYQKTKY